MRIISQDKKYDLPYENYGFMIDGSNIKAIGIPDVIASYPCRKAAEFAMEDFQSRQSLPFHHFVKQDHFCKKEYCDIYKECPKNQFTKYDVILLERPGEEGLTPGDIIRFLKYLSPEKEYYPIEIPAITAESYAMGFISEEAAELLDYEYGADSSLGVFVGSILDDMEKESPDHVYEFTWKSGEDPIRIYLDR